MSPDEKIEPLGPYRAIKPIKEGSVYAKLKIKKKSLKKEEKSEEEKPTTKTETSTGRIDIEA